MNTIIEQIDQDKSKSIELGEIEEALKLNGVLSKEENIQKLVDELNSDEVFEGLSESLKNSLNKAIEDILLKIEWIEKDILIINLRYGLYGEEELTHRERIEKKISNDVSEIVKFYIFNSGQKNRIGGQYQYKREEVELVQLLANMKQANVKIDGERAFVSRQGNKIPTLNFNLYKKNNKEANENSWITNVWIYREELKRLFGDEESNIPSNFFEEKLKKLTDIEQQNEVLAKFGEDTKNIRTFGSYYSKDQKEALKYYFELLVNIELNSDEDIKRGLINLAENTITTIKDNVQELVNKDKTFFVYNNLQKIDTTNITEYTKIVNGFQQGTSKKDIEKMLVFLDKEENIKYIESSHPEFKEHVYEAIFMESQKENSIINQEFLGHLKQKYPKFKLFFDNITNENQETLDKLHIKQRTDTIVLISSKFFEYLDIMGVNDQKFRWYFFQTEDALKSFQEKDYFGKDKDKLENDINLLINQVFFRTSGQNAAKTNAIYSMLYGTEGLGTYPNYSLRDSVNSGVDKIKNILQGTERGFEQRWEDEDKIAKLWTEIDIIWRSRDQKNELIFKNLAYGSTYVENNVSGTFETMQEQDKKNYPYLYKEQQRLDKIVLELIKSDELSEGGSMARELKKLFELESTLNDIDIKKNIAALQSVKSKQQSSKEKIFNFFKNKGVILSEHAIISLAKSYVETEKLANKNIDEQKAEIKKNAIESLKNEQQKVKDKWSNFDPKYATPESIKLYNEEYGIAYLMIEVMEKGQVTVDENVFTIKDFISDEMIENSLKIQHMLTMDHLLKTAMYKNLITSSEAKNDLKKLENTSESNRTFFEKQMYMMNDVLGGGSFRNFSDTTVNSLSNIAETLIVQGAMIAISGGIASVGAAALTRGLASIPAVARSLTYVMSYSRAGLGLQRARKASRGLILLGKSIQIISLAAEGVIFHAGVTTLGGMYEGQNLDQIIDALGFEEKYLLDDQGMVVTGEDGKPIVLNEGRKGYLRSGGFLAVMKAFAPIVSRLNVKYNAKAPENMSRWTRTTNALKAEAATLPGEIAGMMATEQTLNILLDQKLEGIDGESFLNTITIIIGLRVAHRYLPPFHNIKAKIDQKTFETGASKISSSDVNKVISEIGFSESAIFINKEMSGKKSKITNEGWDFAIKGKDGKIVFYNEKGGPILGVEVEKEIAIKETVIAKESRNKENITNKIDWQKVGQKKFDSKLKANIIEVPMKDGKCEYKLFDAKGNEIKIIDDKTIGNNGRETLIELFKKSALEDIDLWGNETYVLKTPYGFSIDVKLIGDMDYSTNSQGMKNFLYRLREKKGKIKNFELTGNKKQKIKWEGINEIDDLFTANGKLKPEIEHMIDNGMPDGQKVRISYDYIVDVKGSIDGVKGTVEKGSINREVFVEDGTNFLEIDPIKSMNINIDGKNMKMLTPEGYLKYSQELLVSDFNKDIGTGISKFKIAKRISDFTDAHNNLKAKNFYGKNTFTQILEYITTPIRALRLNRSKSNVLLDGLEESIKLRKKMDHKDPMIKSLEEVLVFIKEVFNSHENLQPDLSKEKPPINISSFTSKTNTVKESIVGYKKVQEVLKNPELLKNSEYLKDFKNAPFFENYVIKTSGIDKDMSIGEKERAQKIENHKNTTLQDREKLEELSKNLKRSYEQGIKELNNYDYSGPDNFAYYVDFYIIKNIDKYSVLNN